MGAGWSVGFFAVAIPEAEGAALAQVGTMRKTDKIRRLSFCADVDDGLPPLCACDAVS